MSEEFIKKINKEINKNDELEDKKIELNRFQFFRKSNILKVIMKCKDDLVPSEEEWIKKLIATNLGLNITVELLVYKDVKDASIDDILTKYWSDVVLDIVRKNPLSKNVLYSKHKNVKENRVTIRYGSEAIINHLKKKDVEKKVSSQIHDIFGRKIKIELKYDDSLEDSNYEENKAKENKKIIDDVLKGRIISEASLEDNSSKKQKKERKLISMIYLEIGR